MPTQPPPARRPLARLLVLVIATGLGVWLLRPPAAAETPAVTFTDVTSQQQELVGWAMKLFTEAGLPLGGIDVVGFDDRSACGGRQGAARQIGDRTQIRICTTDGDANQSWVILHEIAHAWDHHSLDPERRRAFLELRGLDGWRTGDWYHRGAEQMAEIMVWGLMDRPVRLVRFDATSCGELAAAYRLLTGSEPPGASAAAC